MPTVKKISVVDELAQKLAGSKILILTNATGVPVKQLQEIRRECRKDAIEYHVVKNTLAKLAAKRAGIDIDLDSVLSTSSAIAFGMGDEITTAKIMQGFTKNLDQLSIKGGIFNNQLLTAKQVSELATLPSREQLLAKIMGGLQSPLYGLFNILQAKQRDLLYALKAIAEKKAA
jgi:large subunit ribosomal protein L10